MCTPLFVKQGMATAMRVCALLLLACAPLSLARQQYFGYYGANLTVNGGYSNVFQADTPAEAVAAASLGSPGLLLTFNAFFTSVPGRMILRPDYVQAWEALAAVAAPLLANRSIIGFNLGDELVWNCLSPANLTIVANTVRASFPRGTAIVWYNEATPPLASDIDSCGHTGVGYAIPAALDWFSVDIYHVDGVVPGWVDTWVKSFYAAHIFPFLAPDQSVVLVPGSFGSTVNHYPNGTYVCDQHCYDVMCAHDAQDFASWAATDTRVVAIFRKRLGVCVCVCRVGYVCVSCARVCGWVGVPRARAAVSRCLL